MKKELMSCYIEGLCNMASSMSKSIGPSYIKVNCYDKKDLKEKFTKDYKITPEDLKLTNTNQSLTTTLLDWFYDEPKIVESLTYWIDLYYRGEKKVYLADEKLFHKIQEKQKDFYILDDLFFMEYKDIMIVFLLGNNE